MRFPKLFSLQLVTVTLGIFAAAVPMLLLDAWLKKQGKDEAAVMGAWVIAAVERQVGQTAALLQELSARGVDTCKPAHLEAMRQLVFVSGPIKEVMLVGSAGQVMCADAGVLSGRRDIVASTATAFPDIVLDVIRVSDLGDRFLRVRRVGPPGKPSVAALLPAMALLPQASLQSGHVLGYARLVLSDGTVVGSTGTSSDADFGLTEMNLSPARSALFGISVAISIGNNGVIAGYEDLRRISMVVTGVVALFILGFAFFFMRRHRDTPVADIAKALLRGEFVPYYQPVVDILTGKLLGAEVLVRWRRRDGTTVEPGAFIPLMETSGLVIEMTRLLMRRALKDMSGAMSRRPNLTLAFNVAPQHFNDALILNDVGSIFDGTPIKLKQIVLELTERYEVESMTATHHTVAALQGLGCKVAIDDVGTGHSGLSYILKLGVDIIKIDKIFVEAIGTEGHAKAIIETLVDLARNMRMEIIAEGVETFDQVVYLREHGIRAAQGYAFAPALPASSFLELLNAMDPLVDAETSQQPALAGPLAEASAAA